MNKEEITKEDILNVTGSMFDTMLDYVDNSNKELNQLQQENKQLKEDLKDWNRVFDTFSKRKYAHRYLEERRKEIPNLLCPDSDEIYQKYYELKDNWNKLKEYVIKEVIATDNEIYGTDLLDKMQELEKGE